MLFCWSIYCKQFKMAEVSLWKLTSSWKINLFGNLEWRKRHRTDFSLLKKVTGNKPCSNCRSSGGRQLILKALLILLILLISLMKPWVTKWRYLQNYILSFAYFADRRKDQSTWDRTWGERRECTRSWSVSSPVPLDVSPGIMCWEYLFNVF